MHQCMNGWLDRWMDDWLDGWMDGWTNRWMVGQSGEWTVEEDGASGKTWHYFQTRSDAGFRLNFTTICNCFENMPLSTTEKYSVTSHTIDMADKRIFISRIKIETSKNTFEVQKIYALCSFWYPILKFTSKIFFKLFWASHAHKRA